MIEHISALKDLKKSKDSVIFSRETLGHRARSEMTFGLLKTLQSDINNFQEDFSQWLHYHFEENKDHSFETFSKRLIRLQKNLEELEDYGEGIAHSSLYLGDDYEAQTLNDAYEKYFETSLTYLQELLSNSHQHNKPEFKKILHSSLLNFAQAFQSFDQYLDSTIEYNEDIAIRLKQQDKQYFIDLFGEDLLPYNADIIPYDYQIKALEGMIESTSKGNGLVVLATGLGKTLVIGLFIKWWMFHNPTDKFGIFAHQEHLLEQLHKECKNVFGSHDIYQYFTGTKKERSQKPITLATFFATHNAIDSFSPKQFQVVIVDEGHHAQANTFSEVIHYFTPKFRGAVTATPDRQDLKDIRSIFGDEVFSLPLPESLALGLLTPVDYRIKTLNIEDIDAIIASKITEGSELTEEELFPEITAQELARSILAEIDEIGHPRVKIFTSDTVHADNISDALSDSVSVHSKIPNGELKDRLKLFEDHEKNILISVDMFNEGKDIPDLTVLVFLRSTASPSVFFQQLGRGLRRHFGKGKILVLDYVGNIERLEAIKELHNKISSYYPSEDIRKTKRDREKKSNFRSFNLENEGQVTEIIKKLKVVRRKSVRLNNDQMDFLLKEFITNFGLFEISGRGENWENVARTGSVDKIKEKLNIKELPSYGPFFYRYADGNLNSFLVRFAGIELVLAGDKTIGERYQKIYSCISLLPAHLKSEIIKNLESKHHIHEAEDYFVSVCGKHSKNPILSQWVYDYFTPLFKIYAHSISERFKDHFVDPDDLLSEGYLRLISTIKKSPLKRLRGEVGNTLWKDLEKFAIAHKNTLDMTDDEPEKVELELQKICRGEEFANEYPLHFERILSGKAPLEFSPQFSHRRESFITNRLIAFAMTKKLERNELKKYSIAAPDLSPDITSINFQSIKSLLGKNDISISEFPLKYFIAKYFLHLDKNEILEGFSINESTLVSWKNRLSSQLSKMSYKKKQKLLDILLYSEFIN